MVMNGDCYSVAANNAMDRGLMLCHGRPVYRGTDTPDPDGRFGHAWNETVDGSTVIDQSNGLDVALPADLYYAVGNIEPADVVRFTPSEVVDRVLAEMTWGPWS